MCPFFAPSEIEDFVPLSADVTITRSHTNKHIIQLKMCRNIPPQNSNCISYGLVAGQMLLEYENMLIEFEMVLLIFP